MAVDNTIFKGINQISAKKPLKNPWRIRILWVSLELRPILIYGFNMKIEIEHFSNISRMSILFCCFYLGLLIKSIDSTYTQCSKMGKKCNFKSSKIHFLPFQKWQKVNFCTRKKFKNTKNAIFALSSGAKIDFLPFLKWQKVFFCTFEFAFFSNFRALWLTI